MCTYMEADSGSWGSGVANDGTVPFPRSPPPPEPHRFLNRMGKNQDIFLGREPRHKSINSLRHDANPQQLLNNMNGKLHKAESVHHRRRIFPVS